MRFGFLRLFILRRPARASAWAAPCRTAGGFFQFFFCFFFFVFFVFFFFVRAALCAPPGPAGRCRRISLSRFLPPPPRALSLSVRRAPRLSVRKRAASAASP